jgi:hypothetical protein
MPCSSGRERTSRRRTEEAFRAPSRTAPRTSPALAARSSTSGTAVRLASSPRTIAGIQLRRRSRVHRCSRQRRWLTTAPRRRRWLPLSCSQSCWMPSDDGFSVQDCARPNELTAHSRSEALSEACRPPEPLGPAVRDAARYVPSASQRPATRSQSTIGPHLDGESQIRGEVARLLDPRSRECHEGARVGVAALYLRKRLRKLALEPLGAELSDRSPFRLSPT